MCEPGGLNGECGMVWWVAAVWVDSGVWVRVYHCEYDNVSGTIYIYIYIYDCVCFVVCVLMCMEQWQCDAMVIVKLHLQRVKK